MMVQRILGSPHDFLGQNVNLSPALALQDSDRGAEHDRFNAAPQDGTLAHRAGLGRRVEHELMFVVESGHSVLRFNICSLQFLSDQQLPQSHDHALAPEQYSTLLNLDMNNSAARRSLIADQLRFIQNPPPVIGQAAMG